MTSNAISSVRPEVRARYDELRPRFGSKAAWLMILRERELPQKLGFTIPNFVAFEKPPLVRLRKRYEELDPHMRLLEAKKKIKELPGRFYARIWGRRVEDFLDDVSKGRISAEEETKARQAEPGFYFWKLYVENAIKPDRELIGSYLALELAPLLRFGTRQAWESALLGFANIQEIALARTNSERNIPFPAYYVRRDAEAAFEKALEGVIFSILLGPEEREYFESALSCLSSEMIVRSSGFHEDTFESAMAGTLSSERANKYTNLLVLAELMGKQENWVMDKQVDPDRTLFVQDYYFTDDSGIVFSNLFGITAIEAVIGECWSATAGLNNTVIDLNAGGGVTDVNYGFLHRPNQMGLDGFRLRRTGLDMMCDMECREIIQRAWDEKTFLLRLPDGRTMRSPLDEGRTAGVRAIAKGIEEDLGFAVDVEFGNDRWGGYVFQSRPVTGTNETAFKLPEFHPEDIIAKVPVSIGLTPEDGLSGYIICDPIKHKLSGFLRMRHTRTAAIEVLERLTGIGFKEMFALSGEQTDSYMFPVVVDGYKCSRLYHHGINFRESGTVVIGLPGLTADKWSRYSAIEWREVRAEHVKLGGEDIGEVSLSISFQKFRVFSNGLRAVLVKDGSVPTAPARP